jgi:hypothetical protein
MVSSELIREIGKRYEALTQTSIELGKYSGLLFDLAFEITTAETFVAGVATKIIDHSRLTAEDRLIVGRPFMLEGRWWKCNSGGVFDLGEHPEISRAAVAIEELRATCERALNLKSKPH